MNGLSPFIIMIFNIFFVLWLRFFLDILAAIHFLTKGEVRSFQAVFKAYREFNAQKPLYEKKRKEIQLKIKNSTIPERTANSILKAYYLKGIRKFTQL